MKILSHNLTETPLPVKPTIKGHWVANHTVPMNGPSNTIHTAPLTETSPILLDLRSASDFAAFHLPYAINFPLASLKENDVSPNEDSLLLEAQWLELKTLFEEAKLGAKLWGDFKGRGVVLVCYRGDTARVASSVLRARGVEAMSIRGGMREFVSLARLTAGPP
jgi:rhodanese-related sulfurtransferase